VCLHQGFDAWSAKRVKARKGLGVTQRLLARPTHLSRVHFIRKDEGCVKGRAKVKKKRKKKKKKRLQLSNLNRVQKREEREKNGTAKIRRKKKKNKHLFHSSS